MENDGLLCIYIVYLDARGDIITDDSTTKMPISYIILSADVKLYARDSDSVWGPWINWYSLLIIPTEDEIILGSIYPDIRIPKDEISVFSHNWDMLAHIYSLS